MLGQLIWNDPVPFLVLKNEISTSALYIFSFADWLMKGINVEHLKDNSRSKVKDVCLSPKIALAWRNLIKEIFLLQIHYLWYIVHHVKINAGIIAIIIRYLSTH